MLRVDYPVQGSIQQQGEEIHVLVCLVDGNTGFERWSHGYRGTSGNISALQDDIARAISRELGSALTLDIQVPGPRRTESPHSEILKQASPDPL